jgi:protein involved in polysaccharide export with SLBB domain
MKHILGMGLFVFLLGLTNAYTQITSGQPNLPTDAITQLARSASTYPVTAGDVYLLTYAAGGSPISYTIPIDSSYKIRIANLGIIEVAGKTFLQLKNEVESLVSRNYTMSGVQLMLVSPAVFTVIIKGEVLLTTNQSVWALSRLSSVLYAENLLTPYASFRDVTITSTSGRVRIYDLFKARRFGDLSQDPYLRPGDTITVKRYSRSVTIEGGVERPGTYQLLDNENLHALITIYGNGFTALADTSRIELIRYVNSASISGDKIYLSADIVSHDYTLEDYDKIMVPEITSLLPVMFIEGAIGASADAALETSTQVIIPFNKGENYASLVKKNSHLFSAISDTKNAYIVRGETRIPVNLNPMLYDIGYRSAYFVEENDILIIPFRQYFVTVAGSVVSPGRYPYIPDRNWDYYIALAGGFIPERNVRETVKITDLGGRSLSKKDYITPESIITASTNRFLYYFNQYAPIVTTILGIISTSVTIYIATTR